MNEQQATDLFVRVKALLTNTHVVYTSGRHGDTYVQKRRLYTSPVYTSTLCMDIAQQFIHLKIEAVVSPAVGGVALSQWVTSHLNHFYRGLHPDPVLALFAEKEGDNFVFKEGYNELVWDKNVLVIDDILTTGKSLGKVIQLVRECGGKVMSTAVLWNRGGVTSIDLKVPELLSLVNLGFPSWTADECPLCQTGVPINTSVGHGKEFLAKKTAKT